MIPPRTHLPKQMFTALLLLFLTGCAASNRFSNDRAVRLGPQGSPVRLVGIDHHWLEQIEPARRAHFSKQADSLMQSLASSSEPRIVRVEGFDCSHDKEGCLLCYIVFEDGTDLGERLLREGLARLDSRVQHPQAERYSEAQAAARQAELGIWSLTSFAAMTDR